MSYYPFSSDTEKNKETLRNDLRSHIFKNGDNIVEYDIDVIEEYFPELKGDKDAVGAFLYKINQSIIEFKK